MIGKLYRTRDCQVIQQWAKARQGQPALMTPTLYHTPKDMLCIVFPDLHYTESYTLISWDALCTRLEHENLVFVYQKKTENGDRSQFCRFVSSDISETIATEEAAREPETLSEATGLYQTESLHSPMTKGVRLFRHPNLATTLSGGLLVRFAIIVAIILATVIVVVYWPSPWEQI
jgi:hypothetical protein